MSPGRQPVIGWASLKRSPSGARRSGRRDSDRAREAGFRSRLPATAGERRSVTVDPEASTFVSEAPGRVHPGSRMPRRSIGAPLVIGIVSMVLVLALAVGWQILVWRSEPASDHGLSGFEAVLFVLGTLFFLLVLAGLVWLCLKLVFEMRLNQSQRAFIDAVTHELKTPLASFRLGLETLERHRARSGPAEPVHRPHGRGSRSARGHGRAGAGRRAGRGDPAFEGIAPERRAADRCWPSTSRSSGIDTSCPPIPSS